MAMPRFLMSLPLGTFPDAATSGANHEAKYDSDNSHSHPANTDIVVITTGLRTQYAWHIHPEKASGTTMIDS